MIYPLQKIADLEAEGVASIQTGPFGTQLKASDYTQDGIPVINVRNIGYGNLRADKLEFIAEATADRLRVHVLNEQDIVFGRKGAVDRHLFVTGAQSGWVQGSDCIRLRLDCNRINPRFVSYAFLSNRHKEWMLQQCGNKATMASLNQDVIRRIEFRLPKRPQQDQIVSILSTYDDLIENNRKRIALLEEAARLLYREWFVHFRFPGHEHAKIVDGVPEGWKWLSASEAFEINPKTPREDEGVITYVPMAALSEVGMIIDLALVEKREVSTSVRFRKGDTLFARITPCLENGKTGLAQFLADGEVACGSTEFIVLRGRLVSEFFVYLTAREPGFRENAVRSMIGSSGRQRVQPSCFDRHFVAIPPDLIRTLFDDGVGWMFKQIANLDNQNRKLAQARDLLLPRLMNGEIPV